MNELSDMNAIFAVYQASWSSPVGWLGVRTGEDAVTGLDILPDRPAAESPRGLAREVVRWLEHYFRDPELFCDLPLASGGTGFQERVWAALREIPSGETRSYGELALELDSAPRAVGGACRRNPIAIIVPCHRVVGAQGIGGFSGRTDGPPLITKRTLLAHEGVLLT